MNMISLERKSTMKEMCKKIYLRYEEETFSQSLGKVPFPNKSKKEQLYGVALNLDSVSRKTQTFQWGHWNIEDVAVELFSLKVDNSWLKKKRTSLLGLWKRLSHLQCLVWPHNLFFCKKERIRRENSILHIIKIRLVFFCACLLICRKGAQVAILSLNKLRSGFITCLEWT